jgi:hypothetical protein
MKANAIVATFLAGAVFAMPASVFAQQVPPPNSAPPSYARPSYASGDETITGRIASFDGKFHLEVRDDRGFTDHVELHQGTVILPTGLELQPGMSVTIHGRNAGTIFAAGEIDTPYDRYGVLVPVRPSASYSLGIGIR